MSSNRNNRYYLLVIAILFIIILALSGNRTGRLHYKFDTVEIVYNDLPEQLDGLTIIQLSDLHLGSFKNDAEWLRGIYDSINSYNPDIIVNTGDFVSYNYREFETLSGILGGAKARYGKYAIPGNHDTGHYDKEFHSDQDTHLRYMRRLAEDEGFTWLSDSTVLIEIDSAILSVSGTSISGRIPNIKFGDIELAMAGSESAGFKLVLSHDPNHWTRELQYLDIDLTLSGHTHGMQFGLLGSRFKISPARILFKHWYSLYNNGENQLYVNRGLGTMGPPLRLGMPPEITVIKLRCNNAVK